VVTPHVSCMIPTLNDNNPYFSHHCHWQPQHFSSIDENGRCHMLLAGRTLFTMSLFLGMLQSTRRDTKRSFNTTGLWWSCVTHWQNLPFFFFLDLVHGLKVLRHFKRCHLGSQFSFCLQIKTHLMWWTPETELFSVTGYYRNTQLVSTHTWEHIKSTGCNKKQVEYLPGTQCLRRAWSK